MSTILELPGAALPFESHQEVITWLDQERAKWSWLDGSGDYQRIWNTLSSSFHDLREQLAAAAQYNEALHVPLGSVQVRFANGPLVYSESEDGERILDMYRRGGVEAGAVALGVYRQFMSLGEIRTVSAIRALIEFAFPAFGPVDVAIREVTTERSNLRKSVTELSSRVREAEKTRETTMRLGLWRAARRFLGALGRFRKEQAALTTSQQALFANWEKKFKAATDDMEATKAAYIAHMELQAPVEYWKTKADKHRKARGWLVLGTIIYFLAALGGLGALFFHAGFYLIHHKLENNAALFVAGAGLATLSGVLLWAGRLITRLYLSEHHLTHDAEERAVMTKTYLALTAEKAATDTERAIILAALFRNTSDGVVKDDAAPDLSLGGLIARLASGRS